MIIVLVISTLDAPGHSLHGGGIIHLYGLAGGFHLNNEGVVSGAWRGGGLVV